MGYSQIDLQISEGIATLTLNRPEIGRAHV